MNLDLRHKLGPLGHPHEATAQFISLGARVSFFGRDADAYVEWEDPVIVARCGKRPVVREHRPTAGPKYVFRMGSNGWYLDYYSRSACGSVAGTIIRRAAEVAFLRELSWSAVLQARVVAADHAVENARLQLNKAKDALDDAIETAARARRELDLCE